MAHPDPHQVFDGEGVRLLGVLVAVVCALLCSCQGTSRNAEPSIEFIQLPPAGEGSPDQLGTIKGRVTGAQPRQRIVLFAKSGVWWVQPREDQPFTAIQNDATWENSTHPGSAYAALLVDPAYRPPLTTNELPGKGGDVVAVVTADSTMLEHPAAKTLHFSGYEWIIRQTASDAGGSRNLFDPANAWTDENGFLHLRIARATDHWTSAEVHLTASLGYGTYHVAVRDISHLEPAAVFAISTWDDSGPPREMDIEMSRWGEPGGKNAQYVIQPYYVPANVVRFTA